MQSKKEEELKDTKLKDMHNRHPRQRKRNRGKRNSRRSAKRCIGIRKEFFITSMAEALLMITCRRIQNIQFLNTSSQQLLVVGVYSDNHLCPPTPIISPSGNCLISVQSTQHRICNPTGASTWNRTPRTGALYVDGKIAMMALLGSRMYAACRHSGVYTGLDYVDSGDPIFRYRSYTRRKTTILVLYTIYPTMKDH